MAKVTGSDGTATFNSVAVTVTNWSITIDAPTFDSTDSGSTAGWMENTATGRKGWSGSLEGFLEASVAGATLGTSATLVLLADTGITWTGSAIMTQKTVDNPVATADGTKVSYTFIGTGAVTEANP